MPDNLTTQFLDELRDRRQLGITQPIQPIAEQKRSKFESPSLYEQLLKDTLVETDIPEDSDKASGIVHGVSSALWHFIDSALIGIPGIAAEKITGEKPYSILGGKTEGLATVGGIVGEAAGFLVPLKWIGMGIRGAVSVVNKAGTSKLIGKAIAKGGEVAARGEIGLSREIAERAVKTSLREPQLMVKELLPKYELSLTEVAKVRDTIRGSIYTSLKTEFPDAADDVIRKIGDASVKALESEGVHINNLGRLIERSMNATFKVADKSKITKYIARAAEIGTSFAIYNLMHDGVHSLAGEQEFDPVSDVKDAFIFAAFLPAVEMVGGGGRVNIRTTINKLRKALPLVKDVSKLEKLNKEQANGLLRMISKDSYLSDTIIGKEASNWVYKDLPRDEALDALKKVIGRIDVNTIWKDFYKYAGEDFAKSLGRMTLGALYFNLNTIKDTGLLKALPPEELLTHLLVGAWFTKMKKPPNSFDADLHVGAAYSGMLGNDVVLKIENIFNNEQHRKQQATENWGEPVGPKENISTKYNLTKWAHDIYEYAALSRNVTEPNILERSVNLENLTIEQIRQIQKKLESIEIKEGERLTEDNFDDWKNVTIKESLENTAKIYVEMVVEWADKIKLETDHTLGDKIDLDIPIRMARIPDITSKLGEIEYQELILIHRIRDALQEMNLIQEIVQSPGEEKLKIDDIENSSELKHFIKNNIDSRMDRIRVENYGETYPEKIDPLENAFIMSFYSYKQMKNRDTMFNITEANYKQLDEKSQTLFETLVENFGESVPRDVMNLVGRIELFQPKDMKDDKWEGLIDERIEVSKKLGYLARMWGDNKTTGKLKIQNEASEVDYDTAASIVNSFESEGFKINRDNTEIQRRYYYSRILNSAKITPTHMTQIDAYVANELGRIVKENGRTVLKLPDSNTVRQALTDQLGEGHEKEINELVKKHEDNFESLDQVKGKFIDVVGEIDLKQMDNLAPAIEDAWIVGRNFDKEVLRHYKEVNESIDSNIGFIDRIEGVLNRVYDVDPESGERTTIREFESPEALDTVVSDIKAIRNDHMKDPLFSKDTSNLLKDLITRLIDQKTLKRAATEFDSIGKIIRRNLESELEPLSTVKSMVDIINFNLSNYANDRVLGKRNLDRLTKDLTRILRDELRVDVPDNQSLRELVGKFAKNNKMNKLIERLDVSIRAWRLGVDETTFFEQQRKIAEQYNDHSTQNIPITPDVSPNTISNKYGRYNENIKGEEWRNILTEFNEKNESYLLNPSSRNGTALRAMRNRIRDEVRIAIYGKHINKGSLLGDGSTVKYDTPYDKLPNEAQKEIDNFNKYTFPALLAQQIGRAHIPTASLSYTEQGKPILEVSRDVIGRGLAADFIEARTANNIPILTLDHTGVYEGVKTDINSIESIDKIIRQAKPQDSITKNLTDVFREDAESRRDITTSSLVDVFSEPVRVPVSYNNTFIVGKTQVADGRLNRDFAGWYNTKIQYLESVAADAAQPRPKRTEAQRAVEHMKILFEAMTTETAPTAVDIKQMIRAMYWDGVSNTMMTELLSAARNSGEMNNLAASLFKYVVLAEATGAKTRASEEFYRQIREDAAFSLNGEQISAIDDYFRKGHFEIAGMGDEMTGSGFDARFFLRRKLEDLQQQSPDIEGIPEQINAVETILRSFESSTINAQSYIGTNAAHLLYLAKGRRLGDVDSPFGTAGVKPTGWFNEPGESILLKTNFVYDPEIADAMDLLGIDILTTGSAAKAFSAEMIPVTEQMFRDNNIQSSADAAIVALNSATGYNRGIIRLENLFLGKIEDRKALTNVTYAMTDMLGSKGFNDFMNEFVGYETRINNELGKLSNLVHGKDRVATADYLLGVLREEGSVFEESSTGLLSNYLEIGVDPSSILTRKPLQRVAVTNIVKALRKPKVEGASYAILVPFLEGSIPVYKRIDNAKRQTIIGGKKLPYLDGRVEITDWNKVQYIVEVSLPTLTEPANVRRDIQVGRDENGKWVVEDPYNALTPSDIQTQLDQIMRIEGRVQDSRLVNLGEMHNNLKGFNGSRIAADLDMKVWLHSLSLRMPNLGGDVAVHKIEGFYSDMEGNKVGVNVFDIATIHQADFDVDPLFSYNIKTTKISNEIFKFAGHAVDAYVYDSEGPVINPFGTRDSKLERAGSGYPEGDSINKHIRLNLQAKDSFGKIKRLSTGISSVLRAEGILSFDGVTNSILDVEGVERRNRLGLFIQRYKNVLQSLIDTTKKPNFVSKANSEDIVKFILFDKVIEGDSILRENMGRYGEEGFKPLFEIDQIITGHEKDIREDIIVDANEIAYLRGGLHRFTTNPNQEVYHSLLNKYRGSKEKISALNKLFFMNKSTDGFLEWEAFRKDFRKLQKGDPAKDIIYIGDSDFMKKSNVGNYIVSKFGQSLTDLRGYNRGLERGKPKLAAKLVTEILDEMDVVTTIADSKSHEQILNTIHDSGDIITSRMSEYIMSDISKLSTVNERRIQDYSLLFHSLREEKNSIQRYIYKAGRNKSGSLERAKRKLAHIDALQDYLTSRETEMIEKIKGVSPEKANALTKHFDIVTKDLTKAKKRTSIHNPYTKGNAYVYREVKDSRGRTKFIRAGYIKPISSFKFKGGSKYVILRNPIRYYHISTRDANDAYAMLEVTGEIQIEDILTHSTENVINQFAGEASQLKFDLGSLISEVYKLQKKNPHQIDNWQMERQFEDSIVNDFMKKWLGHRDIRDSESVGSTIHKETVSNLVAYLIKPEPVFGELLIAKDIKLPVYKINPRLTNAVARWMLREMHAEEFEAIFGNYGKAFRRKSDNIIPDEMAELFQSKLYHNDNFWLREKSPIFELAFDKGWLYMPAMRHHLMHELTRRHDRTRSRLDQSGESSIMMQYGTYKDIINDINYYRDTRNFMKDEDKNPWECG